MLGKCIVEVGGSLLMAVITGVCAFGGLAFADYALLALQPNLNAAAAILFLFGLVNLPLFVLWSHQTANEIALLAETRSRRTHGKLPAPR